VVSVAFSRDDFERVVETARREGMRTSEFIREAALKYTGSATGRASVHFTSAGLGSIVYATQLAPSTRSALIVTVEKIRAISNKESTAA
jgi:hypothetical protein